MLQLDRIYNYPLPVRFAGFESDTLTLQRSGWQLSMERDPYHDGIRLALKHEAARVYALTNTVQVRRYMLEQMQSGIRHDTVLPRFDVVLMGNNVQLQIFPMRQVGSWAAIDATPQIVSSKNVSFEDMVPFRPISSDAPEIVVADKSVMELLEMIRKKQDPKQAEIRKRARQAAWLEAEGLREGYNPAADIRCQIVSLAG